MQTQVKKGSKTIKNNKKIIFILSIVTTIFALIATILFGFSNWIDYSKPIVKSSHFEKSDKMLLMIFMAMIAFMITLILATTTWMISLKVFLKKSRTKLSVYGIGLFAIGIFAILLPMLVISSFFAIGLDSEWLHTGVENYYKRFQASGYTNPEKNMTNPYGIINSIYVFGVVISSLFVFGVFVFALLMGVDTFGNTSISNEIKKGGLLNPEMNEYKKGLHKIFRLSSLNMFIGIVILFISVLMPIWIIILGRSFESVSLIAPMIAMVALLVFEIFTFSVFSIIISVKILLETLKLDTVNSGYIQTIHGPNVFTFKILAIIGIIVRFAHIILLVFIHREIANEKTRVVVSEANNADAEINKQVIEKQETKETSNDELKIKLQKIKALLDEEIISKNEYDEIRKRILEEEV
ncbi:hypothetical protein [Mycoplasma todarodis]|uniref:hypothetical protein n=1 Tax=Mycoplasma todarodis TaxID=1937191 RepID=UPI003B2B3A2B